MNINKHSTSQAKIIKALKYQHDVFWKSFTIVKQQQQVQQEQHHKLKNLVQAYRSKVAATMERYETETLSSAHPSPAGNDNWVFEVNTIVSRLYRTV